jgi:hypothetical protein
MESVIGLPPAQGLYDPAHEPDACGVGFIADLTGKKSHDIVRRGCEILCRLTHRGAVGADPTSSGARSERGGGCGAAARRASTR